MRIQVLGSGAGGGFPQWNCNCPMCAGLRCGRIRARPRTQSSIAVSANGADWTLFNASPDILEQIRAFPALQPARRLRDSGIAAIVLMDAQIDHATGLMMLRESSRPLPIWTTRCVRDDLTDGNPLFRLLGHYCGVDWHEIPFGTRFTAPTVPGLGFTAWPLDSNAPPYSPRRDRPQPGDNIGIRIDDPDDGTSVFYAPGLARVDDDLLAIMADCDVVLVDGTVWTDDEMVRLGISSRTGQAMGHLAQTGPGGMIERLDLLPGHVRRVLIHVNNTNPILDEDGPQRRTLGQHGIEVAWDGMSIEPAPHPGGNPR